MRSLISVLSCRDSFWQLEVLRGGSWGSVWCVAGWLVGGGARLASPRLASPVRANKIECWAAVLLFSRFLWLALLFFVFGIDGGVMIATDVVANLLLKWLVVI